MIKLGFTLIILILGFGCAKKSDSTPVTTVTTSGYQLNANGLCVQTSTGQQVPQGYCTSTTSGFVNSNGQCIQTSTGQAVPNSYCTTTSAGGGQCIGIYIYNGQYVQCSGQDCAGFTLIQAQTGTTVNCH